MAGKSVNLEKAVWVGHRMCAACHLGVAVKSLHEYQTCWKFRQVQIQAISVTLSM